MSSGHQLDERVRQLFKQTYNYPPTAVAVAPGRMNVIGEHTDYNDGFVLPAAIDRFVAVAARQRRDGGIQLISDRYSAPVTLEALPAVRRGDWADYVIGVSRQLDDRLGPAGGFDLAVASDLPVGSGLSSSGALEVATAAALLASRGAELPALEVARLCQAAENEFVGARTGIMDQFAAALARAGNAMLLDCRSLTFQAEPLPDARFSWLLADTRIKHELAGSTYNRRREECEAAARSLGLSSLRDATEADLDRLTDEVQRRRARHVISENARVLAAADTLSRRATRSLGPLMYASHESLRNDFSVSSQELDSLVMLAAEVSAVVGARMMGGGFGGCAIILVESAGLEELEDHLRDGYQEQFHRAPEFYRVRTVDGALAAGR